ncbi:MAG: Nif3-like dinuclear metal center hexameric protein, partial [Angelakisella sp.]
MRVSEVYNVIDRFAPFSAAESWDNVGLLVGDMAAEVTGIMTALDITVQVIEEAESRGCNLLISHHPIIFDPLKSLMAGTPAYEAARRGMSVISAHTSFDVAAGGVNAVLAERLGLSEVLPLGGEGAPMMGCMGKLPRALSPKELGAAIAKAVGFAPAYNPMGGEIITVGLCGGSGADLFLDTKPPHAYQAFVTADVKHHQFLEAARRGITLYDGGHYATEAIA